MLGEKNGVLPVVRTANCIRLASPSYQNPSDFQPFFCRLEGESERETGYAGPDVSQIFAKCKDEEQVAAENAEGDSDHGFVFLDLQSYFVYSV